MPSCSLSCMVCISLSANHLPFKRCASLLYIFDIYRFGGSYIYIIHFSSSSVLLCFQNAPLVKPRVLKISAIAFSQLHLGFVRPRSSAKHRFHSLTLSSGSQPRFHLSTIRGLLDYNRHWRLYYEYSNCTVSLSLAREIERRGKGLHASEMQLWILSIHCWAFGASAAQKLYTRLVVFKSKKAFSLMCLGAPIVGVAIKTDSTSARSIKPRQLVSSSVS